MFEFLIKALGKDDKVVILIDEYEKVVSDNIYSEYSEEIRTVLGDFYANIKTLADTLSSQSSHR